MIPALRHLLLLLSLALAGCGAAGSDEPADEDALRLHQGEVARVADRDVGVFYVTERRMKIAIAEPGAAGEGRDVVVEVGGTVTVGERTFTLLRTDPDAAPPYAVLAPR